MRRSKFGFVTVQDEVLRKRAKEVWRSLEECRIRNEVILKWAKYYKKEITMDDFTPIEKTWIKIRVLDPVLSKLK